MEITRRSACLLLPFVAGMAGGSPDSLPSTIKTFESLHAEREGGAAFHPILEGKTHTGDYLEVHETILQANAAPHPAHHHAGEEMFLVISGTVEMTIAGKSQRLGPGSAAFVASNEEHGLRNVGSGPAQYFVVTLGAKAA
jgi:mannose-6-phosphate isomerase-like protein (cupin superfamily)